MTSLSWMHSFAVRYQKKEKEENEYLKRKE